MSAPSVTVADTAPSGWADLVAADPGADFFHTEVWTRLLCRHLPHLHPLWLSVHHGDRLVAGLAAVRYRRGVGPLPLLTRIESHFEGTAGGPLLAADLSDDQAGQACEALSSALRGPDLGRLTSVTVALNTEHEERFGDRFAAGGAWLRQDHPTAAICLREGLDHVEMHRMNKSKRNERNRGLRRGATVTVTGDPDLVAGFHRIYSDACAVWGRTPLPQALLQDLIDESGGAVFLTCVQVEDQVIGGHFNLHHGDRVVAWLGATDPAWARSHFPATVSIWGDLVEACARGASWLDLGGSGGIQSLSGFKKYLGATVRQRGLYLYEKPLARLARRCVHWRHALRARSSTPRRVHDDLPSGKQDP